MFPQPVARSPSAGFLFSMKTPQSASNPAIASPSSLSPFDRGWQLDSFLHQGVFAKLAYYSRRGCAHGSDAALGGLHCHSSSLSQAILARFDTIGYQGLGEARPPRLSRLLRLPARQFRCLHRSATAWSGSSSIPIPRWHSLSRHLCGASLCGPSYGSHLAARAGILIAFTGELHKPSPSGKTLLNGAQRSPITG
jgi:hypothetical protein